MATLKTLKITILAPELTCMRIRPTFRQWQARLCPVAGGSQPHNNLQPFIVMNFIIALVGLYPSRS